MTSACAPAREIDAKVKLALDHLLAKNEATKAPAGHPTAILLFRDMVRRGLIVAGQYGEGALLEVWLTASTRRG